jgi:hypothetical protein
MIDKIVTAAEHVFGVTKEQLVRTEIKRGRSPRAVGDAMAAIAQFAKADGKKDRELANYFGRTPTGIILARKRHLDLIGVDRNYAESVLKLAQILSGTYEEQP